MASLLIIDNYDSFTYNLVQMFMQYNLNIKIYRNDEISIDKIKNSSPDYILISPGPKNPAQAGVSMDFIKNFHSTTPILGICLGMQCINELFGGKTVQSPFPIHGKTTNIYHDNSGLFRNIPSPFKAARYHSLISKPATSIFKKKLLTINAWSSDGFVMGLSHPLFPLHGLQFHPESFLTTHGFTLIENFLKLGSLKAQF